VKLSSSARAVIVNALASALVHELTGNGERRGGKPSAQFVNPSGEGSRANPATGVRNITRVRRTSHLAKHPARLIDG